MTDAAPLAPGDRQPRLAAALRRRLVETPSDFGTQGERPSHPELLDDLAARFIANGWSLKWLHREIMLSATYRQAGGTAAAAEAGSTRYYSLAVARTAAGSTSRPGATRCWSCPAR